MRVYRPKPKTPNGISIGSAAFAGFMVVANTHADTQTTERATPAAVGRTMRAMLTTE